MKVKNYKIMKNALKQCIEEGLDFDECFESITRDIVIQARINQTKRLEKAFNTLRKDKTLYNNGLFDEIVSYGNFYYLDTILEYDEIILE